MAHEIRRGLGDKLLAAVPFGLGQTKPHHFVQFPIIAWKNRDNLPHAWKVLSQGVCDGCALGVAGLHDWTIEGVHLCMTRLELLRLNTMPAIPPGRFQDVGALRRMSNRELRELGVSNEKIALVQVVKVTDRGATGIIVDQAQPAIRNGTSARLTARMP